MERNTKKLVLAIACMAVSLGSVAAELKIFALAQGVDELDLFSTSANGAYVRSVDASVLRFPISVIEDRSGGFVIRIGGEKYYVGAADVLTNKEYQVTASCDNEFTTNPTAATRGIAGKGC